MSITIIIILILSGVIVGFINTLSAGGTTITIALYLALGLPVQTTNSINRVGVIIQNLFATSFFAKKRMINFKRIIPYAIPTMLGAFLGSLLAIKINETVFSYCMGGVMIMMIFFLTIKRKQKQIAKQQISTIKRIIFMFVFFLAGFYGGFVQVGTGFLLITAISTILGYDLVETNANKVLIMFLYTFVALCVFVFRGGIEMKYWIYGIIHAFGNIIGAYIAARYAIKKGEKLVKIVILVVIVLTSLNLFGVIDLKILFNNLVK
ncbi:MAG: sulfite exporter TauE/SafE family protein [Bacteroidales bacterium]|jgi:uncharacterized membrane protein YfcA|nr:sulfite exporter TauE/SafE family protein [Bacteroidales bacterium]